MSTDKHKLAEQKMLAILEDYELPTPDEVEHGEKCVRFLWSDRKLVVVIDLDESGES